MMLITDVGFLIGLGANVFVGSFVAWGLYRWLVPPEKKRGPKRIKTLNVNQQNGRSTPVEAKHERDLGPPMPL